MPKPTLAPDVLSLVLTLRGKRVLLDADLARLYGVPTKRLNEQVRRNANKFPADFAFQLIRQEVVDNWSHFATSSSKHRGASYRPWAFTDYGAIQAANVLNSPAATAMSIYVVRAFMQMREELLTPRGLPDNHEEFRPLISQFAISSFERLSNKDIDTDSSQNATSSMRPREARYDFESQLNYIEIGTIMRSRSQNATLKSGQWPNPSFRLNGFPS